jgi:phosphonate transport system substrate-binding protein
MRTLLLLVTALLAAAAPAHEAPYVLGVHPYLDELELVRRFTPLAEDLARVLARDVRVEVGTDYEDHIRAIGQDRLDVAYLGPASYVEVTRRYGPKPILARLEADGTPSFRGYIVVRDDSPLERLADLKGGRFAFGDPDSTMGTLVPRFMLLEAGIDLADLAEYRHLVGHKNVALAVLTGNADAGALKAEVYEQYRRHGLRALAESPAISEHLFVTRSDLAPALVARLRARLLGLREAGLVERVLVPIKAGITALVPAQDADYDNLRRIVERVKAQDAVGAP